ncbi:MAG: hypothetical protein ACKVI4_13500 [Actinomycetales bacterium]|tara:strand:+ start:2436 stop:2825 length:390 start_codon:yes stop_codon:yes gene_type:complete
MNAGRSVAENARQNALRTRAALEESKVGASLKRVYAALKPSVSLFATFAGVAGATGRFFLAFLGLFILHQLFLWISVRPSYAFERAKEVIYVVEVVWDSFANINNAQLEVVDVLIPAWNSASNVRSALL